MCNQTDVVFCSQVVPTPIVYMLGMELLMGACYLLGAVIYSNAVPEKWRPGMFDVWGHSHNIFHVLVVCGAYIHYKVSLFLVIFGYFWLFLVIIVWEIRLTRVFCFTLTGGAHVDGVEGPPRVRRRRDVAQELVRG